MSSWKLKIWAKQFVCIDFGMLWNIHFVWRWLWSRNITISQLYFCLSVLTHILSFQYVIIHENLFYFIHFQVSVGYILVVCLYVVAWSATKMYEESNYRAMTEYSTKWLQHEDRSEVYICVEHG